MIPGTSLEDNALHRASLWLEDFKQVRNGESQIIEGDQFAVELGELTKETGLNLSGEQLSEGAVFYSANLLNMVFGGRKPRVQMVVVTPQGPLSLAAIVLSAWVDGFQHAAATAAGKYGESNEEILGKATEGL